VSKHKKLFLGMLLGYGLSIVVPPSRITGKLTGKASG
jgi:hypothetical protein